MRQPIPVTIVSGFLGSGKTTLLCDLLKHRQDRRLAVLINELGEVSIDGALARASAGIGAGAGGDASAGIWAAGAGGHASAGIGAAGAGGDPGAGVRVGVSVGASLGAGAGLDAGVSCGEVQIIDFPRGLIAYAEDTRFVPTMQAIAGRRGQVDHVLIETSGVALPSAAMERLQSPELAGHFVLDATLVVVDTPRLLAGEFDRRNVEPAGQGFSESVGLLFNQQLAGADVVVLNKIDELADTELLEAEEQVRRRAPNVRFLELAHHARLDVRLALGLRLHQATGPARSHHFSGPFTPMPGAASQPLSDHGRVDGHSHSGLMAHSHGIATHAHFHEQDPGWLSFTLRSGQHQDVGALRTALERAAAEEPILRCKGFAVSAEAGRTVLLQGVRTRVLSTYETPKDPVKASELVFIGYHLSRARVATTLSRLTGTAWS